MAPKVLAPVSLKPEESPADFESKNVHEVYDAIATHFSSTRYKVLVISPDSKIPSTISSPSHLNDIRSAIYSHGLS